jgi:hypothetical protein
MDSIGVVVLHQDATVTRAVGEAIDAAPDLFVAGITPGSTGAVLVAGGPALRGLDEPGAPLIALADGDALTAARAALSLGARDLLRWPEEAERLADAIRAAARPVTADAPPRATVALAGARGGVGTSTTAALLASLPGDALVLDLSAGAGQRAFAAEEPVRTVADIGQPVPGAVEAALVPHAGGSRAVHATAGALPDGPAVLALVRAARRLGPVFIDAGGGLVPGQRAALEAATARVLVAGNDIASIRGGRALLERVPGTWTLVVRRVRRAGVPVADVAAALGLVAVAILRSNASLARAVDLGRLPRRRSRAIVALASSLEVT